MVFNGARIARDYNARLDQLDDFARAKVDLPPEVLQKLAKEFFDATLDLDRDLLVPRPQQAARSQGFGAPPIHQTVELPSYFSDGVDVIRHAPRPEKPVPVQPKAKRPGWVEELRAKLRLFGNRWLMSAVPRAAHR